MTEATHQQAHEGPATTTVRGWDVAGAPGLYVEDSYGCSWEHPEDISEQGWRDVTYSAQAVASTELEGDLPVVEVSGYAPRSAVVGLAREVASLRETLGQVQDQLRLVRIALSVAGVAGGAS